MSKELLTLVEVIANEKNLSKSVVFASIEKSLSGAAKKSFGASIPEIDVKIDPQTGLYKTIRKWTVVEVIDDIDKEITLDKLKDRVEINSGDISIGDIIEQELHDHELGRVSAHLVRHAINQHLRDAEREAVLKEYLNRSNGIIAGKVKRIERGNVIIECGKIEAIILKQDLIKNEVVKVGSILKGFFDISHPKIQHGRIYLSRTDSGFLIKLFESHVPELAHGKIVIMSVARIPGDRAKISIALTDQNAKLDLVGAFIGFRGQRVNSVANELFGEKIDIIKYSTNLFDYVVNALAPAKIASVTIDESKRIIDIIANDQNIGSAVGYDGINVRLASKLLNYTINIMTKEDAQTKQKLDILNVSNMFKKALDVDIDIAKLLIENGFSTLEEIAYVSISELLKIKEFSQEIAKELQLRAKNKLLAKSVLYKDKLETLSQSIAPIVKFPHEILLILVESGVYGASELADLSSDELIDIIDIDIDTANQITIKARELCGYI